MLSKEITLSSDSVWWLDPQSDEHSEAPLQSLERIVMKNHVVGALEWFALGLVAGATIGAVAAGPGEVSGSAGIEKWFYGFVYGGIAGALIGGVAGSAVGHDYIYEFRLTERTGQLVPIEKSSTNTDVIYLRSGVIVRGIILGEIREGTYLVRVTIRNESGKVHTYEASDIERIEKME